MVKSKKGQVKIQQMAFLLLAITLFFVLAGLFMLSTKMSSLKKDATVLNEKNAMALASKVSNSPEFSCQSSFSRSYSNCIDMDKLFSLKNRISKYTKFWGVENIEVVKIFPSDTEDCTQANYPKCGRIQLFEKEIAGFSKSAFVMLCHKARLESGYYNKCELAKIIINYNAKN